jgi:hypothetical protein
MPDSRNDIEVLKAENEVLKFRVDAAERLAALDKLIQDGESSNRFLQSTIKFLGIGSIGGLIALIFSAFALWPKLDNHIDRQIAAHMQEWNTQIAAQMQKWSDLDVGFGSIHENRWAEALTKLGAVYDLQVKRRASDKDDKEYRSLLFSTLLWVLASTSELTPDRHAWKGEWMWNTLCGDSLFQTEVINRARETWDEAYCNKMLLCTLKFEKQRNVPKNVRDYLMAAFNTAPVDSSKAEHSFQLAMECLAENKIDEAQTQLEKASEKDSQRFKDMSNFLTAFKRAPEFTMWCIYTERLREKSNSGEKDFDSEFDELAHKYVPPSPGKE